MIWNRKLLYSVTVSRIVCSCIVSVQYWKDERLRWDPSEYGGASSLRVTANRIWKPDLRLYNASV